MNKTDKRVKFLSKSDLLRSAFFQYGDPAIAALYEKGYSYPNAKEILENLYFLRPGNEKINALSAIRKELEEKNLLEVHADFSACSMRKAFISARIMPRIRKLPAF